MDPELRRKFDEIDANLRRAERLKRAYEIIIGFLLGLAIVGWLR